MLFATSIPSSALYNLARLSLVYKVYAKGAGLVRDRHAAAGAVAYIL